jgi:hypothetical protein
MISSAGRSCRSFVGVFLLLAAAAPAAADERRPLRMRTMAEGATLDKAFAVLGRGTVPDGRLFAPFYDCVISPHAVATDEAIYCAV